MNTIAVLVTLLLTDQPWQQRLLETGYLPQPTLTQVQLFTVFTWLGLALIAAVGVLWFATLVRASRRRPSRSPSAATHCPPMHAGRPPR